MALKIYKGKTPLPGHTYKAMTSGGIGEAEEYFSRSGMEFMLYLGEYYYDPDKVGSEPKPEGFKPPAWAYSNAPLLESVPVKSDGGPSTYYDFLPDWVTLNDAMEYLAENRWGKYALHLKDSMKACFRFGSKEGADVAYDAKKLVYSGLRLLVMIQGKYAVQEFLDRLSRDPQFQGKKP